MSLRSHELSVCVQEPVVDVFVFLTHDNTEQLINVVNDAVCRSTFLINQRTGEDPAVSTPFGQLLRVGLGDIVVDQWQ